MSYERCEDAPACGHVECGFGPGVPGYGSMVGGMPFYGSNIEGGRQLGPVVATVEQLVDNLEESLVAAKTAAAAVARPDYDEARRLLGELTEQLSRMPVHPSRPRSNGATMFSKMLKSVEAYVTDNEARARESET